MAFRDLRTVERTIRFCLKMESSSSWLLLVVVLMATTDLVAAGCNLDTGRVKILGEKKIDVVIEKTRAPIITIRFFYSKETTLIKSTIRIILLLSVHFLRFIDVTQHTYFTTCSVKFKKSSSCTLGNTGVWIRISTNSQFTLTHACMCNLNKSILVRKILKYIITPIAIDTDRINKSDQCEFFVKALSL